MEFQIFRIKVFPSKQGHLFRSPSKPSEILMDVISSLPSVELKKEMGWHVGNVSPIDSEGLYFRIGRTAKFKLAFYKNGTFRDEEFEGAPYTHVLIDLETEVVAIAKKPTLSPKTSGIANNLIRLLNEAPRTIYYEAKYEIAQINDPTEFITFLNESLYVTKFFVTFSRPNALDVDDFIKPMQKLLSETEGDEGKTIIEGTNLNPERLENLARSAAATGNDAAAWMQLTEMEGKVRKNLKGNPATLHFEDISDGRQKYKLLHLIREIYKRIRGDM